MLFNTRLEEIFMKNGRVEEVSIRTLNTDMVPTNIITSITMNTSVTILIVVVTIMNMNTTTVIITITQTKCLPVGVKKPYVNIRRKRWKPSFRRLLMKKSTV